MKKNMKLAAVFTTAALLTLGASMTSMAAQKGTWKMDGNDWMCYDKNGDAYESTFALSNGKEYYLGDDGYLVRSQWVEFDGDMYYVNSAGQKVVNDWKFVTPYDDEDAEEEWFYFQSSGKAAESKKMRINEKTYYFDENGKMITGWVSVDGETVTEANEFADKKTFFTDETGARVEKAWVKTAPAGAEEDSEDEFWYYIKSNGETATGKQGNIKGQTYFFNKEGQMQTGWVALDSDEYKTISGENAAQDLNEFAGKDVYFCGGEDDGHAKKDKWFKTWSPVNFYDQDADEDQNWYYIEKDGKVFIPETISEANSTKFDLEEGHYSKDKDATIKEKKINGKDYYFNQEAQMVTGFHMIKAGEKMIYLGSDGAVKTGSFTVNDDNDEALKFYFETTGDNKGVGFTGNKNGKLYFKGQLVTAEDSKYEVAKIGSEYYIVNNSGSVQTSNREYTEDGTKLIDGTKVEKTVFAKDGDTKGSFNEDAYSKIRTNDTNLIDVTAEYLK